MSREWKPGTVAMVTSGDVKRADPEACADFDTVVGVRTGMAPLGSGGWNQADGHWIADEYVYEVRPLVVIDPESDVDVARLENALEAQGCRVGFGVRAALREFANPTPPRPPEPTGLGAVVEDDEGRRWVLLDGPILPDEVWYCGSLNTRRAWAKVAAVRVLSEGVS